MVPTNVVDFRDDFLLNVINCGASAGKGVNVKFNIIWLKSLGAILHRSVKGST